MPYFICVNVVFFSCMNSVSTVMTVILLHHFNYEELRKMQCFVYVNQFIVRRP